MWRSRHQILSRLAVENQVLHVSPQTYIRDVCGGTDRQDIAKAGLVQVAEKLHSLVPPRWLPAVYGYPKLDATIRALLNWQIRRAMRRLGMKKPILYVWHPGFADVVGKFSECLVVYHVYDEYASFSMSRRSRELLNEQERQLLLRADIVFAASDEIRARRLSYNPNVHVIPNGVNYETFSTAQNTETLVPKDIEGIRGPIVGCVATLATFLDLALLISIFSRRPDWSFVLIGVDASTAVDESPDLARLRALPNVHFIGRRHQDVIPNYLKACDVCLIVYVLHDVTMVASTPLKLYEYLAAGKPIVSSRLPLPENLANVVHFAADTQEWIEAIEWALKETDRERIGQRQKIARANSWDSRAMDIKQQLVRMLKTRLG